MDERSMLLLVIPAALNWGMFHVLQTVAARCRLVMLETFDPARVLDAIEHYHVTSFGAPPTALIALLQEPGLQTRDLASLELITTAGASCPIEILRDARERLRCRVIEGYGMTEVGWISCTDPADPPEQTVGTVGRPFPWVDVRLLDAAGSPLPSGEGTGEIAVGGPCLCGGYYRNPQLNGDTFTAGGLFRTGDLGTFDVGGRLRLVGRSKDVIKHAGRNVFPREIEELLYAHPKIQDVAVIGVPDDYFGENACACVVPSPGAAIDLEEVVDFLRGQLATYKLPQQLEVLGRLPYTATGKVQKTQLREWVLLGLGRGGAAREAPAQST